MVWPDHCKTVLSTQPLAGWWCSERTHNKGQEKTLNHTYLPRKCKELLKPWKKVVTSESHPVVFMCCDSLSGNSTEVLCCCKRQSKNNKSSFQKAGLLRQFCDNQVRDTVENTPEICVREHCNRTCE